MFLVFELHAGCFFLCGVLSRCFTQISHNKGIKNYMRLNMRLWRYGSSVLCLQYYLVFGLKKTTSIPKRLHHKRYPNPHPVSFINLPTNLPRFIQCRQEGVTPVSSWWLSWRSSLVWDETHATHFFSQCGTGWWWLRPAKHLEWTCANEKHVVEYWGPLPGSFCMMCLVCFLFCWSVVVPKIYDFYSFAFGPLNHVKYNVTVRYCLSGHVTPCDNFLYSIRLGVTEHSHRVIRKMVVPLGWYP